MKHWKWKPTAENVIKLYNYAKAGLGKTALASAMGMELRTLIDLKKREPIFRDAIERGRRDREDEGKDNLSNFIYKRLPKDLKELWDRILATDNQNEADATEQVRMLFASRGREARQHIFLYAYVRCDFSLSEACRITATHFRTVMAWRKDSPKFQELCNEILQHKKNFFESALIKLVKQGDTSAIIFANKTINRDRGYTEKLIIEDDSARAPVLDVSTLDLPLEVRKQILEAIRKKKELEAKAITHDDSNIIDAEFEEKVPEPHQNGKVETAE